MSTSVSDAFSRKGHHFARSLSDIADFSAVRTLVAGDSSQPEEDIDLGSSDG